MNILRKIFSKIRKAPLVALLVLALLSILSAAVVKAEFYPNRVPFDYNKPSLEGRDPNDPQHRYICTQADADQHNNCGSMTGPVFDSFINTPSYGDERSFVDARRSDQTASGSYKNVLPDVTNGSKEVVVRMYVHNNANQDLNGTNFNGSSVAHGASVRVFVPTGTSQALRARGYIDATNAAEVEDTVDFTASDQFSVSYMPGSAILYNNGPFKNGTKLSDSIVTTGAPIGYSALNGEFPGCFDYEATVEITLKVTPKPTPKVDFHKQNAVTGQGSWGTTVTTKPGDTVKWYIPFTNSGTTNLTGVDINDKLPPHLTVVPGSVKWVYVGTNGQVQTVTQSDTQLFTTGGIKFTETWTPSGGFYLRYDTLTKDDFDGCSVALRNIAYNTTDQTSQIQDHADVTINKQNCTPPVTSFSCDALDVNKINRTTFKFTAHGSVQNANITGYTFKVDGTTKQDASGNTYTFVEDKPGTYTVTVQVKTDKGTTAVSDVCTKKVTVTEQPKTPVYSCDAIDKEFVSGRTYQFTTATTADGGATVKQYNYEFVGDNYKATALTNQPMGKTQNTFPGPGTYVITVSVDFNVNNTVKSATSEACKTTITIPTETEKCTVAGKENFPKNSPECQPTPTVLVNTGPGDIAGIFAAVSVAGALVHRFILSRRFN